MDVAYRLGRASAAEILREVPEPPSYSAVRALLRILVDKGHLRFDQDGPRYVYSPTVSRRKAAIGRVGATGPHVFRRVPRASRDRPARFIAGQAVAGGAR